MTVVGIKGDRFNDSGVSEDVVELARELLAMAERGEIIGLAAVILKPNLELGTFARAPGHRHMMLAGAVYLQHDISSEDRS